MAPLSSLLSSGVLASLLASVAAGPLLSAYWPAYVPGVEEIKTQYLDLAYYYYEVTTATGFILPPGQPLSQMQDFVSNALNNSVSPVLSIGGWSGSQYFSTLLADSVRRTDLANKIVKYLLENKFKGIDIDWEYPDLPGIGCNAFDPNDTNNFLSFIQALRGGLGTGFIMSATVSPSGLYVGSGKQHQPLYDVSGFAKQFDFINIMTYNYGRLPKKTMTTGPSSPLYTCHSRGSIVDAVKSWTAAGFPAAQIFVTIPSYGHSYVLESADLLPVRTTRASGTEGDNTVYISLIYQNYKSYPQGEVGDPAEREKNVCGKTHGSNKGLWHYTGLVKQGLLSADGSHGQNGFVRHWDECTQTPYLFNPQTKVLITYEDAASAGAKAAWIKQNGLKGLAVYTSEGFDDNVYGSIATNLGSKNKAS